MAIWAAMTEPWPLRSEKTPAMSARTPILTTPSDIEGVCPTARPQSALNKALAPTRRVTILFIAFSTFARRVSSAALGFLLIRRPEAAAHDDAVAAGPRR